MSRWLFFPSATTASDIISNGLIVHLDAGNSSSYPGSGTTWTDLSSEGNDGTLVNGPTFTSDDGGSLVFDGINDYVNLGAVQVNTAAGTIGMWVKLDSVAGRFFGRGGNFESRFSGTRLVIDMTGNSVTSSRTSWSGAWLYVVIGWDENANSTAIYVNGVSDATGTCSTISTKTGDMNIGRSSGMGGGGGLYVPGKIAAFHSYNRLLTTTEIQSNFDTTKTRFGL